MGVGEDAAMARKAMAPSTPSLNELEKYRADRENGKLRQRNESEKKTHLRSLRRRIMIK